MISTAAASSIRSAAVILGPHEDEDLRVAGLIAKLNTMAEQADDEQAAARLERQSPNAEPGELKKAERAQRDYLRKMSPAAADAWEAGHAA